MIYGANCDFRLGLDDLIFFSILPKSYKTTGSPESIIKSLVFFDADNTNARVGDDIEIRGASRVTPKYWAKNIKALSSFAIRVQHLARTWFQISAFRTPSF